MHFGLYSTSETSLITKPLDEYEIDIEKAQRPSIKSYFKRLAPKGLFDRERISRVLCEISIFAVIFILPNAAAIAMSYFYVYASVNPSSAIALALHLNRTTWLVYQVFLPLVSIAAGLVNLMLLVGGIKAVGNSLCLMFLALVVAFTPIWCPYVVEAGIRKYMWDHVCDGYDANIYMDAVNYNKAGMSYANFPASLGGQKWQIYQSVQGVYEFAPVGGESKVTYDFRNETYIVHNSNSTSTGGNLTDPDDQPLSFPEFGLNSTGDWTRSCYAPAVTLRNPTGNSIIKTGLSSSTDCSTMEVCAMKSSGLDAVLVAVGRILIALEVASQCCTRPRYG